MFEYEAWGRTQLHAIVLSFYEFNTKEFFYWNLEKKEARERERERERAVEQCKKFHVTVIR
jgi:hypothetical protein